MQPSLSAQSRSDNVGYVRLHTRGATHSYGCWRSLSGVPLPTPERGLVEGCLALRRVPLRASTCCEFIHSDDSVAVVDREFGQRSFDFSPDTTNGDSEDALTSVEQIDDFFSGGTFVDGCTITHQGDG